MKSIVSPPLRRIAAVAILAILLLLIYAVLISPFYLLWQHQREETKNLSAKHARYTGLIASEDIINKQYRALESQLLETGLLSKSAPTPMIAADIQSQIGKTIADLGGVVLSTSELPVLEKEALVRTGIRVNCEGDLSVLVNLLKASENNKPFMLIDNLTIHRSDLPQPNDATTKLAIGFDVYNYALKGEP
mgnify:CR=1 FL=1